MTKISQRLLKEHLYSKQLAGLAFRGDIEFEPFLQKIAPIFNLDRFLANKIGLLLLHRRGYSASSVSETLKKAKELAGVKRIRLYGRVVELNENRKNHKIHIPSEFYPFSSEWKDQEERIRTVNHTEVLEILIECFNKHLPTYYDPYQIHEIPALKGELIDISFLRYLRGDEIRDAYIQQLQERLKIYDIGSGDTTGLVKLVEPGEQLSIEF